MRTRRFELLRPGEIVAERERCPLVYVPVAPLEWHSLHMPMGTDPLNATAVAHGLAERTGGVVMPTFFWGTERERTPEVAAYLGFARDEYVFGIDFPNLLLKSPYCREEFLALLMREQFDILVRLEYKLIAVVNGHGALNQVATFERLAAEFSATTSARVILFSAWLNEPFHGFPISHADVLETSLMMALHPDSVDLTELPPAPEPLRNLDYGIVDAETWAGQPTPDFTLRPSADPRLHASAELGQQYLAAVIQKHAETVRQELAKLAKLSHPATGSGK